MPFFRKWVLQTNDETISLEDAAAGYKGLLMIERVAELKCRDPWPQIRQVLATLQAAEFLTPKFRFSPCNEPSRKLLRTVKSHGISMPQPVLDLRPNASGA